ncbi:LacI family DNA-binding transcriptional regulator [Mesorhizobium sp. A623]
MRKKTFGGRATLSDVARLAGVSLGSASRALSVPHKVKPATLARVNQAVSQLGYIRNGAAQALASRRTRTIAAVYPTLSNPIFADSIHSLQQKLWEASYQLIVASHEYIPGREDAVLQSIVERGVDGIVLVGSAHSDFVYDLLRRYQLPYVLSWSHDDSGYAHQVGFSHYDAARRMATLVLEYGHTDIALCYGDDFANERARARVAGTRDALKGHGLALKPEWILQEPYSVEGGRRAISKLAALDRLPTALLCSLDLQAIGAIDECRQRNIRVPDDLSIVGSDDTSVAVAIEPSLTTISVPADEIGSRTADRILSLIDGNILAPAAALETKNVIRASLKRRDRR